ncbi:hypothetical protein AGMMS49574_03700 [Bacteroidia bacterium]|nr:hypothetical protein AGMMS49574_03700 [Bacteroidia bacterium]
MKNLSCVLVFAFLLFTVAPAVAQKKGSLPRSTPKKEKVDVEGIKGYLDAAKNSGDVEIHSIMVVRNGKVVYEEWLNGGHPDSVHMMQSVSKSFLASAIAFAIDEGKVKLDDKVISYFPDELPETVSPWLAQLSIRHLLMMSAGQRPEPVRTGNDWVKNFLNTPITKEPGTYFFYNSIGSFMLSAIIQKTSGVSLFDYLTPRLFEPLSIKDIYWTKMNQKTVINEGAGGLFIHTEDMAKFGQLFLQHGKWNGKQLLPKGWTEEASKFQIESYPGNAQDGVDYHDSEWGQGYGYQMWRCKHNIYRADGAFGQFIFVIPEKNTVIAITANSKNTSREITLVWDHILPALK